MRAPGRGGVGSGSGSGGSACAGDTGRPMAEPAPPAAELALRRRLPPPAAPAPGRRLRQHEDGLQGPAEPVPEAPGPGGRLRRDLHPRPGPGHQPGHQHRAAAPGGRRRCPAAGRQHLHRGAGRRAGAPGRRGRAPAAGPGPQQLRHPHPGVPGLAPAL
ncbi:unnamed protein product, partial [Eretmochelys imbricata]